MASGRLGTADLAATTITDVYTVPASTLASANVVVCNRNATSVKVRIAHSDTTVTQGNDEFLLYDVPVPGNSIVQINGVAMAASQIITAYSDTANVNVVVTGIEETV